MVELGYRKRFTGKQSLVSGQIDRLDQSEICWNHSAGSQLYNVPDNKSLSLDDLDLTVPDNLAFWS